MITEEMKAFFREDVVDRFLRYVKIYTTSDEDNPETPSTTRQLDLAKLLETELRELGLQDILLDSHGYVYATLPGQGTNECPTIGLLAHLDTSPDQPGENVKPRILKSWDGSTITYPDDPDLTLSVDVSEELRDFIGDDIITASGLTLLGADDKAGVAEIMAAMAVFRKFPELPHGEIRICFTPDEEIGRGTVEIDQERLPKFCYTLDGGYPGELEGENFDAWRADINFKGVGVHPGYAKDKMVNAIAIASRFVAALPEWETPEHTEKREGFYHLVSLEGDFEQASATFIIRDFEHELNEKRMKTMSALKDYFEHKFPGLIIELSFTHQYENMRDIIREYPEIMDLAQNAMEDAGVKVIRKSIRGGTDGARLTQLGHPTPNLFAGGLLFHSRKEWVAVSSMCKAVETVIFLAKRWSESKSA